jgi:hypothetical protein
LRPSFFFFGEQILVGVVHLLIVRDAHAVMISFRLVFNFGAAFVKDQPPTCVRMFHDSLAVAAVDEFKR